MNCNSTTTTTSNNEYKLVCDLAVLLKRNGDRILNDGIKLTLTARAMTFLTSCFQNYCETDQDRGFEVVRPQYGNLQHYTDIHFLFDFMQKTPALKIVHGTSTLQGSLNLQSFKSLTCLDMKRVPVHLVRGLRVIRAQLWRMSFERCVTSLSDLFSSCGGDRSEALPWLQLTHANISCNNIEYLDQSLALLPVLTHLDLSHNGLLHDQDYLENLSELKYLNLAFNKLTRIPNFNLSTQICLMTLILRNNNLDSIKGIENLQFLMKLDLSFNCLCAHSYLNPLRDLNGLTDLCLNGNPLSYHAQHRKLLGQYLSYSAVLSGLTVDGKTLSKTESVLVTKSCTPSPSKWSAYSPTLTTCCISPSSSLFHSNFEDTISVDGSEAKINLKRKRKTKKKRRARVIDVENSCSTSQLVKSTEEPFEGQDRLLSNDSTQALRTMALMRQQMGPTWLSSRADGDTDVESEVYLSANDLMDDTTSRRVIENPTPVLQPVNGNRVSDKLAPRQDRPNEISVLPAEKAKHVVHRKLFPELSEEGGGLTPRDVPNPVECSTDPSQAVPDSRRNVIDSVTEGIIRGNITRANINNSVNHDVTAGARSMTINSDNDKTDGIVPVNSTLVEEKSNGVDRLQSGLMEIDPPVPDRTLVSEEKGPDYRDGDISPSHHTLCNSSNNYMEISTTAEGGGVTQHHSNDVVTDNSPAGLNGEKTQFLSSLTNSVEGTRSVSVLSDDNDVLGSFIVGSTQVVGESLILTLRDTQIIALNINCVRLYSFELNAITNMVLTTDTPNSTQLQVQETLSSNTQVQENLSSSTQVQENLSSSTQVQENLSSSTQVQENLSSSTQVQENLSSSTQVQETLSLSTQVQSNTIQVDDVSSQQHTVILHLAFNYLKKEKQSRKYLLFPEEDYQDLWKILEPVVAENKIENEKKEMLQCLKCSQQFTKSKAFLKLQTRAKPSSTTAVADKSTHLLNEVMCCPDCKSDMIVLAQSLLVHTSSPPVDIDLKLSDTELSDISENPSAFSTPMKPTDGPGAEVGRGVPDSTQDDYHALLSSYRAGTISRDVDYHRRIKQPPNDSDVSVKKSADSFASEISILSNPSQSSIQVLTETNGPAGKGGLGAGEDSEVSTGPSSLTSSTSTSVLVSVYNNGGRAIDYSHISSSIYQTAADSSSPPGPSTDSEDLITPAIYKELSDLETSSAATTTINSVDSRVNLMDYLNRRLSSEGGLLQGDLKRTPTRSSDVYTLVPPSTLSEGSSPVSPRTPDNNRSPTQSIFSTVDYSYEDFTWVDHRLKLYFSISVFEDNEHMHSLLRTSCAKYMKTVEFPVLLVVTNYRIYIMKITKAERCSNIDWLEKTADHLITDLQYIDIGMGTQSFRLEFDQDGASYKFLIRDKNRCQKYLKNFTDFTHHNQSSVSKLKSISKNHSPCLTEIYQHLLADTDDTVESKNDEISLYILAFLKTSEMDSSGQVPSTPVTVVVTNSCICIANENHQFPLPKLQKALPATLAKRQFSLRDKQTIINISSIELYEDAPCTLTVNFSEDGSDDYCWHIDLETEYSLHALVDALRQPWEDMFCVELNNTIHPSINILQD